MTDATTTTCGRSLSTGQPCTDHPIRPVLPERHRAALHLILRRGGHVVLVDEAARQAWNDGLAEAVARLAAGFTPEELDAIAAGAE